MRAPTGTPIPSPSARLIGGAGRRGLVPPNGIAPHSPAPRVRASAGNRVSAPRKAAMTDASPTNPAPPTLTAAERLLAIEGIKRTFAGRLRCMDTKDWASYASFHTDDVVSDSWNSDGAAQPETGSDAAGTDTGSDDRPAPVTGGTALTAAIRATLDG